MSTTTLQLQALSHSADEATLHARDCASLAWFVPGSDIWVRPADGGEPVRVRAAADTRNELGGTGTILLPAAVMKRAHIAETTPVLITSAKPHAPSVAAVTRIVIPPDNAPVEVHAFVLPPGVPPELLPNVPRRTDPSPERLIILFDNSLEEAKSALQSLFIEKLARPEAAYAIQADEVGLIRFGGDSAEVVFTPTAKFIDEMPKVLALDADGMTPMDEALRLVPDQFRLPVTWTSANRRAILLTDGGATVSREAIDALVDAGVVVIAIAIGGGTPTLGAIASATGGAVVTAEHLWQLDGIFAALA